MMSAFSPFILVPDPKKSTNPDESGPNKHLLHPLRSWGTVYGRYSLHWSLVLLRLFTQTCLLTARVSSVSFWWGDWQRELANQRNMWQNSQYSESTLSVTGPLHGIKGSAVSRPPDSSFGHTEGAELDHFLWKRSGANNLLQTRGSSYEVKKTVF